MPLQMKKLIPGMVIAALLVAAMPAKSTAEDLIEKSGVALGMGVGNLVYVPAKLVSVFIGALAGALSYVVTGGDPEVAQQVWRDTQTGPYYITPELAKQAIGERPEKK
ncbi:MAG: hypothetical protein FJ145_07085 [Deltaproteobacteria bacterium]|nr:hypothetical protein [Deltaproteobacteria bacterium]